MNVIIDNKPKTTYRIIIDGSLYWKEYNSFQACQKDVANFLGFVGTRIDTVKVVQKNSVVD